MKDGRLSYFIKLLLLFVIYFASGKFGLHLSNVNGFAAPIWPPSGIALTAIFLLGYRFWPAIAVGATLVNFTTGASFLASAGIGAGNTMEALTSAYLLNNFTDFRSSLERLRDVTVFIILAAFLATVVSATIGTTTLLISQNIHLNDYGITWRTWWMGDTLGVLVLAPLVFVWYNARLKIKIPLKRILEAAGLTLGLILLASYVFSALPAADLAHFRFGYLIFPILIVIALRFGQLGSVTAVFAVAIMAIWFTAQGFGPFAAHQLSIRLAYLQTFLGVTSMTFLVMASIVSEQIATQRRQQQLLQEAKLLRREQSKLKAITKAQDEFTSLASHQLRTPATAVKQYMGLLLENYVGKLTKNQRTMLQRAYESNERQLKVLDDLLKVARVDLGNVRLNKEKINLVELLEDVI